MTRLALAMLFATLSGCATSTRQRGALLQIVFASNRHGNTDLYSARLDGSELRRLTTNPAADQFPRCSPDGRSVVFVRGEREASEIVLLDLATGKERALTNDEVRDATPNWSPDGRAIYFTRREGGRDRIAVMATDGSGLRFLTDGTAHDVMPGISPDGRMLVHHSYRYGRETELQLVHLRTGRSSRLTTSQASEYEASFAGDGTIVFSTNVDGGHYRLYALDVESGGVHLLADAGSDAWGARHSRRTGDVLFYSGRPDAWRLMLVPLAGGEARPVIDDGFSNAAPDWCGGWQ